MQLHHQGVIHAHPYKCAQLLLQCSARTYQPNRQKKWKNHSPKILQCILFQLATARTGKKYHVQCSVTNKHFFELFAEKVNVRKNLWKDSLFWHSNSKETTLFISVFIVSHLSKKEFLSEKVCLSQPQINYVKTFSLDWLGKYSGQYSAPAWSLLGPHANSRYIWQKCVMICHCSIKYRFRYSKIRTLKSL